MAFPYSQTTPLVNSISAKTTVTLQGGMQVATIEYSSAAGLLGKMVLSPIQPTAGPETYKRGQQVLVINQATFTAAQGFVDGNVFVDGSGTDQHGKNDTPFSADIADWTSNGTAGAKAKKATAKEH
ncbi:MAG TPA: hypothetical protein VM802_23495 [Chitinophaga sp.]|uniref:hypothetical protein n=1 Tax=Chitinophaga sp. TaxID=1869181 RepID=UPI002C377BDD|nr:hypothetical protein [Chitinophaga sp.]HVI47854.1 hypothetical protein [Chitinophaga sp.]